MISINVSNRFTAITKKAAKSEQMLGKHILRGSRSLISASHRVQKVSVAQVRALSSNGDNSMNTGPSLGPPDADMGNNGEYLKKLEQVGVMPMLIIVMRMGVVRVKCFEGLMFWLDVRAFGDSIDLSSCPRTMLYKRQCTTW